MSPDLPSPSGITETIAALRRAGPALRGIPASEIATRLGRVGERFLDPDDPLRARALVELPKRSGLSPAMSTHVLDGMARDWTAPVLGELLRREFGDPRVLDGASGGSPGPWAWSPGVTLHIGSGTVPGVTATSLLRSLLVKSPALVKPGRGDETLTSLWAEGLTETDPELAEAVAVLYWPGGSVEQEESACRGADRVVVYGSDTTVSTFREWVAPDRLVAYSHKIGLGVVGPEVFGSTESLERVGRDIALAVATFDQRGCVSPQQIWVRGDAAALAEAVAAGFEEVEQRVPLGRRSAEEASAFQQRVGTWELRAAAEPGVHVFTSPDRRWAIGVDPSPELTPSCLGRFVSLHPIDELTRVPALLRPHRRFLQTVAVEGVGDEGPRITDELGRLGVSRVTTFARAPWPRPWWRHDGKGPLRVLVEWLDGESD